MQFTPENAAKILCGEKTQTRRIIDESDSVNRTITANGFTFGLRPIAFFGLVKCANIKTIHRNKRLKWKVGAVYAVCPGRGKAAIGRVRIKAIRAEHIQDITARDCWAEGIRLYYANGRIKPEHRNQLAYKWAFRDLWQGLYQFGKQWNANPAVWVLDLEVVT